MSIFFDAGILFILELIFGVAALDGILNFLEDWTFDIYIVIGTLFFFLGMYFIVSGFCKYKYTVWKKIVRIFQGIVCCTIFFAVLNWLEFGEGYKDFEKADYIIWNSLKKYDLYITAAIISVMVIIVISILAEIVKHIKIQWLSIILGVLVIVSTCVIYVVGTQACFLDEFNNSINKFDTEVAQYEVIKNVNIRHKNQRMGLWIKAGVFSKGTQLYSSGYTTSRKECDYIEVTDGTQKVGFVPKENLKTLYDIVYKTNEDTYLYKVGTGGRIETFADGKLTEGYYKVVTGEVSRTIPAGTKIKYWEYLVKDNQYIYVVLEDGTDGCLMQPSITAEREFHGCFFLVTVLSYIK